MSKNKFILEPIEKVYKGMVWKDVYIDGIKFPYKISNKGVLISYVMKWPRKMSGHLMPNGYIIHCLKYNGHSYWELEHRLVAKAFIPKPDHLKQYDFDELEVNHIKGDFKHKSFNSVENLEWTTSSENNYHAYKTGLKKQGENHSEAIYTNEQIEKVCKLLEENVLSRMEISKSTKVDDATVGMILAGSQWMSISKKYDFTKRKKKHTLYDKKVIRKAITLIQNREVNQMTFADIGREVGMSRTSVWYLHNKLMKFGVITF